MHRIVGLETRGVQTLIGTKGDANAAADVTQRLSSDAIGMVRFSVPLLGYALYVLQQPIVAAVQHVRIGQRVIGSVTLPRFHVHQIVGNFLMNGGRDGKEGVGSESAVHRGVQD